MAKEETPKYIEEFKTDLINHIDSSINTLAVTIYNTVVLKEDINDIVRKSDIEDMVRKSDITDMVRKSDIMDMVRKSDITDMIRRSDIEFMVTTEDIKDVARKSDIDGIHRVIGSYEVRAQNIEDILLKDHKPRIIDLEKEIYSK